jgi:hypothetical protein
MIYIGCQRKFLDGDHRQETEKTKGIVDRENTVSSIFLLLFLPVILNFYPDQKV